MRANEMPESIVNVARFLPETAREWPEGCAVRAPRPRRAGRPLYYDVVSFAGLEAESNAAARLLRVRGIGRGTRVLLMVRPGLDLIRLTFALFKLGAVPVVIDPGMGLRQFLHCVRRTEPRALVGIPLAHAVACLFRRSFRSVRIRLAVGTRGFRSGLENAISEGGEESIAPTRSEDLAAILFTSGSTGPPKGVCYEHGMFEAQVRLIREFYAIEPGEVDLPMLPVFALFNPAMGMTTVVPEMNPSKPAAVDPERIVQAIVQNRVTNSFGSPVLWRRIGRYCVDHDIVLPSIKRILMAGAPAPPEILRLFEGRLPNGGIHTPYGATEALPVTSIAATEILEGTWERTESGAGTCVGRAFPGVRIEIHRCSDGAVPQCNPDTRLAAKEIGEIRVNGPIVTHEYDRLPDATRRAKIVEPDGSLWHRMGDIGYLDDIGRLWFCGRQAERVQSADQTYYTDCCEAIFNRHPAVVRTALVGLGDPGAQVPAIVVEPKPESFPRTKQSAKAFVGEILELGKRHNATRPIRHVFFKRRFPVDVRHNAKIHRLTLQKLCMQRVERLPESSRFRIQSVFLD